MTQTATSDVREWWMAGSMHRTYAYYPPLLLVFFLAPVKSSKRKSKIFASLWECKRHQAVDGSQLFSLMVAAFVRVQHPPMKAAKATVQ
mmetsp:Transcript_15089/g.38328  ORF Transcript_15089/g.38328 Transcript_15089/m.38328 type:complete len:89 (+) Transcript_15089:94-360(+)